MNTKKPNSSRVESVYCASCDETVGVWVREKERKCIECGQTVYDDYESYIQVGKSLGGRYSVNSGGNQ